IEHELQKLQDVRIVSIDVPNQTLVVELTQSGGTSVHDIQTTIESNLGLNTVVKGLGDSIAAVSEITGDDDIIGVVRFSQQPDNRCLVDAVIDGIRPQIKYSLNIHTFGDLSGQAFEHLGSVYLPIASQFTANDPSYPARGALKARVDNCDLSACIGRALSVSLKDRVIGAGIVARASSVGDNSKKICACSGRTLWDERAIKQEDRTSRL
ncbi:unnamed protein product, partial [Oppiella nova]